MAFYPQFKTLSDICSYHAAERGERDALVFRERVTSYAALDQYADQLVRVTKRW